jgi:hypothetical protein
MRDGEDVRCEQNRCARSEHGTRCRRWTCGCGPVRRGCRPPRRCMFRVHAHRRGDGSSFAGNARASATARLSVARLLLILAAVSVRRHRVPRPRDDVFSPG